MYSEIIEKLREIKSDLLSEIYLNLNDSDIEHIEKINAIQYSIDILEEKK